MAQMRLFGTDARGIPLTTLPPHTLMAPLQSLTLLRAKLAAVHDPDAIGLRVFFEFVGALVGVCIGWAIFSGGMKNLFDSVRRS